jgi:hypothetical protein
MDLMSTQLTSTKNTSNINEYRAKEWIKCRANPFYFIYNYVYIPETGSMLKMTDELMHPKMKRVIRLIYFYHKVILMASRQLGKALHIDTPIPVANGGYKYMKDITSEDYVLDGNGNPTKVVATTDIMYNHDCFEIKFDNGEVIIADADHLWKVSNSTKNFKNKIKTTREIYNIEQQISKWKNSTSCRIELSNDVPYSKNVYIKSIKKISSVPVKCIQVENSDGMYLCGHSMIPTHNSTISAMLLAWAMVFFPRNRAIILNFSQKAGLENLQKIKFIIQQLPEWMVTKKRFKSKSDLKTYFELFNDSRVDVFYPSTTHSPDTLARSLTSPILYIDEASFIANMGDIYGLIASPII